MIPIMMDDTTREIATNAIRMYVIELMILVIEDIRSAT